MNKNSTTTILCAVGFLLGCFFTGQVSAQSDPQTIVDVVWLRDGSKLSGIIVKWELDRGMEFKLMTGATMVIPKREIVKVFQDMPFASQQPASDGGYTSSRRPYSFKEQGLYQTFSCFLNLSSNGGVGIHYSMGHRFNRLLGVGMGIGIETNDLNYNRGILPVYAEARGYFVPEKISPYYALKIGYGFALKSELDGVIEAQGGIHFSPEIGVRFGGNAVHYYLGVEYKIQNAKFTSNFGPWDPTGTFTDKVSYRRMELRTGIVF